MEIESILYTICDMYRELSFIDDNGINFIQ